LKQIDVNSFSLQFADQYKRDLKIGVDIRIIAMQRLDSVCVILSLLVAGLCLVNGDHSGVVVDADRSVLYDLSPLRSRYTN